MGKHPGACGQKCAVVGGLGQGLVVDRQGIVLTTAALQQLAQGHAGHAAGIAGPDQRAIVGFGLVEPTGALVEPTLVEAGEEVGKRFVGYHRSDDGTLHVAGGGGGEGRQKRGGGVVGRAHHGAGEDLPGLPGAPLGQFLHPLSERAKVLDHGVGLGPVGRQGGGLGDLAGEQGGGEGLGLEHRRAGVLGGGAAEVAGGGVAVAAVEGRLTGQEEAIGRLAASILLGGRRCGGGRCVPRRRTAGGAGAGHQRQRQKHDGEIARVCHGSTLGLQMWRPQGRRRIMPPFSLAAPASVEPLTYWDSWGRRRPLGLSTGCFCRGP